VDDVLTAAFEYNTDLFDATTIDRVSRHFQNLLAAIVRTPNEQLARLSLLDEQEVQQQLLDLNATAVEYPTNLCLHQLVEASAARTPDAVAVSCGSEVLTYAELDRRAERLAGYLRSRGVCCEDRVGLLMERSPQLVVALLAVLKSGGAYLPLDAAYPVQRLEWMMADAGVKLLLSEREVTERVFGAERESETEFVYLSEQWAEIEWQGQANEVGSGVTAANAAYVIYTSGSTGVPKASLITHAAAVNYTCWARDEYLQQERHSFPFFSSLSFDLTVTSIFTPLISGNTIVI